MAKTALIILENHWWDLDENPGQASVFPFFHGLERLIDNVRVYHATFYDQSSLQAALLNFSINDRYDRYILYIASHGSPRKVASIQIANLADTIRGVAKLSKIEGVIIGSCLVGTQTEEFKKAMIGSSIVWMMGYKGAVNWLTSTLIDLAVIENMLEINKRHIDSRDKIFKKFTNAIERFNPYYVVAEDKQGGQMSLIDTLSLVIQAHGQGKQPVDMTDDLRKFKWVIDKDS